MPSLTGQAVLVLAIIAALVALAGVVALAVVPRRSRRPARRRAVLAHGAGVLVLALLAQGFAVLAAGLVINDQYDFYATWSDLAGEGSTATPVMHLGGLTTHGEGRLVLSTVHHHRIGRDDRIVVWLPPQYDEPAYRHHRFPVLMFMPGQPSSPPVLFRQFDFARIATQAIRSGLPPFIAVLPTVMIDPPRDTECTNIPHGPAAETWLARVVPDYVTSHFRAAPTGPGWSAMGWSTGGFCAAKLMLAHQQEFGSAASFGGYYQPIEDHTTGSLFGGSRLLKKENSPMWLLKTNRLLYDRLLVISSKQDHESWPPTRRFLQFASTEPHVSYLAPSRGGHNYRVYRRLLPTALRWVAQGWVGQDWARPPGGPHHRSPSALRKG